MSNTSELDHHLTRMDLVLALDPFTRRSINHLDVLEDAIRRELAEGLGHGTELDLTGDDRESPRSEDGGRAGSERINLLVTVSVLAVLVVLLDGSPSRST